MKATGRLRARAGIVVLVLVILIAGAGYWWTNRPSGPFKANNSGLYPIKIDDKYGYIDQSGKVVIRPQFDLAYGFSEGLAQVRIGNKSGYITTKGDLAITPQFDGGLQFQFGLARVKICCGDWFQPENANDRYGLIDTNGKFISVPNLKKVGQFNNGLSPIVTAEGRTGFIDRSGKVKLLGKFDSISLLGFTEGLAPVFSGGKWGYIDNIGEWRIEPQFEAAYNFSDGLAGVKIGGLIGFIDKSGKFVINPQFEVAYEFSEGLSVFKKGNTYGAIDSQGVVVIDSKYPLTNPFFKGGHLGVKVNSGWGIIDRTGATVVDAYFDYADGFEGDLASVRVGGKAGYVDRTGKLVFNPFPSSDQQTIRRAAEMQGHWQGGPGSCLTIAPIAFPKEFLGKAWYCEAGGAVSGVSLSLAGNQLRSTDGKFNIKYVSPEAIEATYEYTSDLNKGISYTNEKLRKISNH